jgi:hypothetical protein
MTKVTQKISRSKNSVKRRVEKGERRNGFLLWRKSLQERLHNFLLRRPHRSFKRTYRRDYVRSLALPGHWAFTNEVRSLLWRHKKTFLLLALVYGVVTLAVVGLASQSRYEEYNHTLQNSGNGIFEGNWWEIGKAGILLTTGILGSLNDAPGDVERVVAVLVGLMVWLTTVWLLRAILAGKKPKLRDGLYNAGAPILSTLFVFVVLLIQLLPVALAAIAFTAGAASGLIDGGVESMVFWVFEVLLLSLSLYIITSTLFALIVVTLPGMYPTAALRTAGDLVIGRRIRILLRFAWLFFVTVVLWAIIMIPIIFFDNWLKSVAPGISWIPIVPICLLIIGSISIIWLSAYTYLLYRKVVDDGTPPA